MTVLVWNASVLLLQASNLSYTLQTPHCSFCSQWRLMGLQSIKIEVKALFAAACLTTMCMAMHALQKLWTQCAPVLAIVWCALLTWFCAKDRHLCNRALLWEQVFTLLNNQQLVLSNKTVVSVDTAHTCAQLVPDVAFLALNITQSVSTVPTGSHFLCWLPSQATSPKCLHL